MRDRIDQLYVAAGFLVFALYGCINGFSTIIFVGPYRQQAKKQLIAPFARLLGIWKRAHVLPALAWIETNRVVEDRASSRQTI